MLIFWIAIVPPILFTCALLYVLPNLSRNTHLFAVTVPPSFRGTEEARAIIRNYRRLLTLCYLAGLAGAALFLAFGKPGLLPLALLVLPVAGSLATVALCHRAALRYAVPVSGVRVASLAPRIQPLTGGFGAWTGPFAILTGATLYLALRWDEIPSRFPIHWGPNGQPNGWGDHTFAGVYGGLATAAVVCLYLFASVWLIGSHSRGSVASRRLTGRMMLGGSYYIAALFAWNGVRFPFNHAEPSALAIGIMVGAFPVMFIAVAVHSNMAKDEPEPESDAPARAPSYLGIDDPEANSADANWKSGLFYFDPEDPALFIEKRIGIGYGLNFGNPLAWIFLGFVLLIPAAVLAFSKPH